MNLRGLVWRELIGSSHRRSTYILRSLYLGLTALLAFSYAWSDAPSGGNAPGKELFVALATAEVLCLGALGLFLAHFSMAAEKTSGRLDLLLATGKSCPAIVAGKLAGTLALPVFLLLAGLPAMLVAVALGGVSGADVLILTGVVLMMILLMGALGAVGGSFASLGLTFALPAVYLLGPVLAAATGLPGLGDEEILGRWWLPFAVLKFIGAPVSFSMPGVVMSSLALSALCLSVSVFVLPRPRSGWLARGMRALGRELRELNRRFARGVVLVRSHSPRLLWSRPLVWREGCRSPFVTRTARARFAALLFVACGIFWMFLYGMCAVPRYKKDLFDVATALSCFALFLAPGVWAARSASVDKSRGALDILLASPARDRWIVLACVRSTVTLFAIPLLFLFLHELLGRAWGEPGFGWRGPIVASSGVVFGATFGAACGYRAKTQARAVLAFLAALAVWAAGGPIASVLLEEMDFDLWWWFVVLDLDLEECLLSTSPVIALIGDTPFWLYMPVWVAPAIGSVAAVAALYLSVTRLRKWVA